ncbi:hypothetical protein IE077_003563 [Cardiosporidium cionae]|uniref:Uncharacterized protein n=1 Tax=Cardiosporidium cionae TaxID=476202 RepID=A0ABQ7J7Y5_9APIC|nr:hypothetical protein IE077_003563 [Cardiosporidium cionae]|eukprot:KAF8820104.1 hypothetical protein IE077_003563 [Cardiosporidium cionae]
MSQDNRRYSTAAVIVIHFTSWVGMFLFCIGNAFREMYCTLSSYLSCPSICLGTDNYLLKYCISSLSMCNISRSKKFPGHMPLMRCRTHVCKESFSIFCSLKVGFAALFIVSALQQTSGMQHSHQFNMGALTSSLWNNQPAASLPTLRFAVNKLRGSHSSGFKGMDAAKNLEGPLPLSKFTNKILFNSVNKPFILPNLGEVELAPAIETNSNVDTLPCAFSRNSSYEEPKNSPQLSRNVLNIEATKKEENSMIFMNPNRMKELGIFKGDTVLLKGRKQRETVAIAIPDESLDKASAALPSSIRNNLRSWIDSTVRIFPFNDIKVAKSMFLLPFGDTLKAFPEDFDAFEKLVKPFFHQSFRPVHFGDHIKIKYEGKTVEFKILQIAIPNDEDADFGVVGPETVINCKGEPLSRANDDASLPISDEDESLDEIGYDDVGGLSNQIAHIRELIDLPLRHPEVYESVGIPTPRGVLLHGSPGCGKTMIARAIAAETGAYFYVINGPEIMSKLAGESELNLRRAFEKAVQNSPSIIFIDEIDSIAIKRDKAGDVERRVVSQLLTLLDGLKPSQNVICLAATNRPNSLDPALRRFGRFDRELEIPVPDESGRLDILRKKTKRMRLAVDVDLIQVSKDSHGFVGADISQLCLEAALQCIRSHLGEVDFDAETIPPEVRTLLLLRKWRNSVYFECF